MIKKLFNNRLIKQLLKFGIVGGIAFIIDYGVYTILFQIFHLYYVIASIISFTISFLFNYILSIKWVFVAKNKQTTKDFIIFLLLSLIGLLINSIILYISVEYIHINEMISKIIATFIVMIYNFITRKLIIEKGNV